MPSNPSPRWNLEDVQRVLYNIVTKYERANGLGRDDEFLRDAIRIGKQTLQDNHWWPEDDIDEGRFRG